MVRLCLGTSSLDQALSCLGRLEVCGSLCEALELFFEMECPQDGRAVQDMTCKKRNVSITRNGRGDDHQGEGGRALRAILCQKRGAVGGQTDPPGGLDVGREIQYNIHPSDRLGFSTPFQKGQIEENGRRPPRILPSSDTFCTCHMTYSFVKDRRAPWAAPHIYLPSATRPITHNRSWVGVRLAKLR